jgi:hypothetical protein
MVREAKTNYLAIWAAASALMLPFFYALAIGPAVWFQGRGFIDYDSTRLIFAPLIWLCDRCGPLNDLVNWYIDIWRWL